LPALERGALSGQMWRLHLHCNPSSHSETPISHLLWCHGGIIFYRCGIESRQQKSISLQLLSPLRRGREVDPSPPPLPLCGAQGRCSLSDWHCHCCMLIQGLMPLPWRGREVDPSLREGGTSTTPSLSNWCHCATIQ
jgi:hypothetical protein